MSTLACLGRCSRKSGPVKATPLITAAKRVVLTNSPANRLFATKQSPNRRQEFIETLLARRSCARDDPQVCRGLANVVKKNINRANNMFVKISIVAAAFAGFVVTGFAGVIVDEPFNYAPGSNLGGQGG